MHAAGPAPLLPDQRGKRQQPQQLLQHLSSTPAEAWCHAAEPCSQPPVHLPLCPPPPLVSTCIPCRCPCPLKQGNVWHRSCGDGGSDGVSMLPCLLCLPALPACPLDALHTAAWLVCLPTGCLAGNAMLLLPALHPCTQAFAWRLPACELIRSPLPPCPLNPLLLIAASAPPSPSSAPAWRCSCAALPSLWRPGWRSWRA